MRILFFGNDNNVLYSLASNARDIGHDAYLIVTSREILHRPESVISSYQNGYPYWIFDYSDLNEQDYLRFVSVLKERIKVIRNMNFDVCFLNSFCISLADELMIPHVSVLTGTDLLYYANLNLPKIRSSVWSLEFCSSPEGKEHLEVIRKFVFKQRQCINHSLLVLYAPPGLLADGDRMLKDIGVNTEKRMSLLYSPWFTDRAPYRHNNRLKKIFSGCRVSFNLNDLSKSDTDDKGSDLLIHAYKLYKQCGGKAKLFLPTKGKNVRDLKKIISCYRIEDEITWLPEMDFNNYIKEIQSSDVVLDQLGRSFPAGVAFDAYNNMRCVIAKMRNEVFHDIFGRNLPGFDVTDANNLCDVLLELEDNPEKLTLSAEDGYNFAKKYLHPKMYCEVLFSKLSLLV